MQNSMIFDSLLFVCYIGIGKLRWIERFDGLRGGELARIYVHACMCMHEYVHQSGDSTISGWVVLTIQVVLYLLSVLVDIAYMS